MSLSFAWYYHRQYIPSEGIYYLWYYMYRSSPRTGVTVVSIAKNGGAVHENDTIMITCCAYNGLADGFEWARLDAPAEIPSKAVGVNSSTLLIPNASLDDLGLYACSSLQTNQSDPVHIVFTGGLYGKLYTSYIYKRMLEWHESITSL